MPRIASQVVGAADLRLFLHCKYVKPEFIVCINEIVCFYKYNAHQLGELIIKRL